MLKAVIFDMDGVIVDTEPLHARAAVLAAEEFHLPATIDFCYHYIGSTTQKMFEDLILENYSDVSVEELLASFGQHKKEMIRKEGYPFISGIKELISDLYKHGLKLAIASSSPKNDIIQVVKAMGIQKYFDKLVSGAFIENPKPSPDIFQMTLKELGVKAEEAIVIEDSMNGISAAHQANIASVGYVNPQSGHQDLSEASVLVESIEAIDYNFLKHTLMRHNGEPITIAHTKRLIIRELTVHDITDMYKIYQNEQVRKFVDDMDDYLEVELIKHKAYIKNVYGFYGYGLWGVFDRTGATLIGRCGIQNNMIDGKEEIELSYLLDRNHWGFGYALECTRAVLTFAAKELGISRVVAIIDKRNKRSIQVAKRLGMEMEKEVVYHNRSCYLYCITDILESMKRAKAVQSAEQTFHEQADFSIYEKKYKD